jgi:hypothetical protein
MWKERALAAELRSAKTSKTLVRRDEFNLSPKDVLARSLQMQLDMLEMQKKVA